MKLDEFREIFRAEFLEANPSPSKGKGISIPFTTSSPSKLGSIPKIKYKATESLRNQAIALLLAFEGVDNAGEYLTESSGSGPEVSGVSLSRELEESLEGSPEASAKEQEGAQELEAQPAAVKWFRGVTELTNTSYGIQKFFRPKETNRFGITKQAAGILMDKKNYDRALKVLQDAFRLLGMADKVHEVFAAVDNEDQAKKLNKVDYEYVMQVAKQMAIYQSQYQNQDLFAAAKALKDQVSEQSMFERINAAVAAAAKAKGGQLVADEASQEELESEIEPVGAALDLVSSVVDTDSALSVDEQKADAEVVTLVTSGLQQASAVTVNIAARAEEATSQLSGLNAVFAVPARSQESSSQHSVTREALSEFVDSFKALFTTNTSLLGAGKETFTWPKDEAASLGMMLRTVGLRNVMGSDLGGFLGTKDDQSYQEPDEVIVGKKGFCAALDAIQANVDLGQIEGLLNRILAHLDSKNTIESLTEVTKSAMGMSSTTRLSDIGKQVLGDYPLKSAVKVLPALVTQVEDLFGNSATAKTPEEGGTKGQDGVHFKAFIQAAITHQSQQILEAAAEAAAKETAMRSASAQEASQQAARLAGALLKMAART